MENMKHSYNKLKRIQTHAHGLEAFIMSKYSCNAYQNIKILKYQKS